jgi:hypothetical protein
MHVTIELFEQALEAIEHDVECGLLSGEIRADEFFEPGRIAVIRSPELSYLAETTFEPKFLWGTVLGCQFLLQLGSRVIYPRG